MVSNLEVNFDRWCRLCAEQQDVSIMIFSVDAEAMLLQNKINSYLLIEVDEDDKLPKNICLQCCSKLQSVCDFIDMARRSQELLSQHSIMLESIQTNNDTNNQTAKFIKEEPDEFSDDDEVTITEMEVSVDPMMVLQNIDEVQPSSGDSMSQVNSEEVTFLHDNEDVTIKLIKKGPNTSNVKKPFPCIVCKRSFCTELALKNHSWVHEEGSNKASIYKCVYCGEGFDFKCYLLEHLKIHRTSGMCQICGRGFRSQKNLEVHMAIHRKTGAAFTCRVCGRSYKTKSNLKTHSITHSNERPYTCSICKKSFKRNQDLKFHINQHTGAKPYKCPFCDKSFASSGNCYSHRSRMHPGKRDENARLRRRLNWDGNSMQPRPIAPKPPMITVKGIHKYQCHICQHSFLKKDNYTYHMFQHTGEKPFQCSFCAEKFVTRRGLLIHHDKVHPAKDRPLALLSKNALLK